MEGIPCLSLSGEKPFVHYFLFYRVFFLQLKGIGFLQLKGIQLLLKLPWEHIDISKHSHNYQKMRRPKAVKPSLQGQWLQNETGNVYQQAQRLAGWALLGSVMINIHSRMLNHTKNIRSPNHRGGQWGTQSQIIQWPPSSARKMRNSRKTKLRISLLSIFW